MISNLFKKKATPEVVAKPYTRQHRLTAVFMLCLTLTYLVIELAFNARLLDVVGSVESHSNVEAIEVWGRLISGTALALYIAGNILMRGADEAWSVRDYMLGAFKILLACSAAMVAVYQGQKLLVDVIVSASTPDARRHAAILVPMTKLVQSGHVAVDELDLVAADYAKPEGKSFLATLPLQALNHPQLFEKLDKNIQPIFHAYAVKMRAGEEGETDVYTLYTKSVKETADQYEGKYVKVNAKFQREIKDRIESEQRDAWEAYKDRLRRERRNLTPNNVPRSHWQEVKNNVRYNMGIPVPHNWVPSDRATFNRAVAQRIYEEAEAKFINKSEEEIGVKIGPGYNREKFFSKVEDEWRKKFEFSSDISMVEGIKKDEFNTKMYPKIIQGDVTRLMKTNYAKVSDYKPGARFAKQGEDMFRALVVPPIALCFSLLGAMVHFFKVFAFAVKIKTNIPKQTYRLSFCAYLFFVAVIPYMISNKVTDQKLFSKLEHYTVQKLPIWGHPVTSGIRWVTQFQPFFYPINNFSRTKLLNGVRFDHKIEFDKEIKSFEKGMRKTET